MKKLRLWLNLLLRKRKSIKDFVEDMLVHTDKIFMQNYKVGTPEYDCQQSLMKGAARYRLAQLKETIDE